MVRYHIEEEKIIISLTPLKVKGCMEVITMMITINNHPLGIIDLETITIPRNLNYTFYLLWKRKCRRSYLDWEMKVEQLFVFHQVNDERKVPMATLSFQGHVMYW